MKIPHLAQSCRQGLFLLILTVAFPALAQQESIVIDPATGDYTITYQGLDLEGNPKWHQVVYVPATKIEPEVKSKFRVSDKRGFTYSYKIRNHSRSKQAIRGFRGLASHADSGSQITPQDWDGNILPDFDSAGQESGYRVNWSFDTSGGLAPGRSQGGFSFESLHLPGVGIARLTGAVNALNGFPDEGPGDDNPIYPEYRKFMRNDFVSRFVAVPKIPVPTPFDAAMVLGGIQKHIKDDLLGMKLIDPVLASQLDRSLQAALDAAKINNTAAVRSNLKEARRLLKKEHEDVDSEDDKDDANETRKSVLIDRLAAKVLDFDLKYVEKRLKVE
jgi:hypothetical protein